MEEQRDANLFDAMPASDDEYDVDFTETESKGGFQIIEKDRYVAKVVEFQKGVSAAGNQQFIWTFKIMQGNYKGSELKLWTALHAKARWKVAETLEALGIPAFGSVVKISRTDILGRQCIIDVSIDEFEKKVDGKMVLQESNKIDRCYPIKSGAIKENKDDIPIPVEEITKEEAKATVKEKVAPKAEPKKEAPKEAKDETPEDDGQALFR